MDGGLSPVLIGITGRLGVGKSTLADMLAAEIEGARVVAFADALKRDVHDWIEHRLLRPLTPDEVASWKGDCLGPLYQGWGELVRRLYGEGTWIRELDIDLPPRAIVADVRHVNEAEWLKGRGGLLVALSGPCRRPGDARSTEHPSEAHVPEVARTADVAIVNDWTLDRLRDDARRVARMALSRAGESAESRRLKGGSGA